MQSLSLKTSAGFLNLDVTDDDERRYGGRGTIPLKRRKETMHASEGQGGDGGDGGDDDPEGEEEEEEEAWTQEETEDPGGPACKACTPIIVLDSN